MIQTPDRWVVIEITAGSTKITKILSGWYGGYLGSDEWRLSSEIESVVEHDDRFEFLNTSGSSYICRKQSYGMTGLMASVCRSWENDSGVTIEVKDEIYNKRKSYVPVDITMNGKLV